MAKAAIVTGPNKVMFDEVEVREPEGNEVKVKITAVGICGTNMTVVHGGTGMFPSVPGHEGAGIVEAVGPDVTKFIKYLRELIRTQQALTDAVS